VATTAVHDGAPSNDNPASPHRSHRQQHEKWSLAEELLCPISLELPLEPVVAEDGRIYELQVIQKHISSSDDEKLKSPVTNKPMGPKLVPCLQIKNIIEKAIESGEITGDLADNWNTKRSTKQEFHGWLAKADKGDAHAMVEVAKAYTFGLLGCDKNLEQGRDWWRKAAEADHTWGLTFRAYVLLTVQDTAESVPLRTHGIIQLTQAAERGSDLACFLLGMLYADGNEMLPQSKKRAGYFLRKGLSEHAKSITCLPAVDCTEANKCNLCLFCDIKRKEATEYLKQLDDI
jgi:hypothetical protein